MTLRHRVHRVLYVPLDDRPVNLGMPPMIAGIVDYEMRMPPRELLGCYETPGRPEEIAEWLLAQAQEPQDCLILSLDMLLYGGLVASRRPDVLPGIARKRLHLLPELRRRFPGSALYACTTICRLEFCLSEEDRVRYEPDCRLYTRLANDPREQERVEQVLRRLPESLVQHYQFVRRRNHEMNLAAVDHVAAGELDFLLVGQDDADVLGFHVAEREALRARVEEEDVPDKVVMCAGADEIGCTLFSHFLHEHMEETPRVAVIYLDEEAAQQTAPFEDRPFAENLREQARAAGVELVVGPQHADMVLAVSPPVAGGREEVTTSPEYAQRRERLATFAAQIADLASHRGVALCDAAFPNGAEDAFMEELDAAGVPWPRLLAFAAWNTAGNSVGTALAHGTVRMVGLRDKAAFDLAQLLTTISPMRYFELLSSLLGAEKAHLQLLLTRLADDWLYQTRVRPLVLEYLRGLMSSCGFDLSQTQARAQEVVREKLTEAIVTLWVDEFLGQPAAEIGPPERCYGLVLAELQDTRVQLPWRRLFEVELELDLGLELATPVS